MRTSRLKQKVARVWGFFVRHQLDIGLLLGFVACTLMYVKHASQSAAQSDASPVAYLRSGDASRHERGAVEFSSAPIGTAFYNLDAIWVGAGGKAVLTSDDGVSLELGEKTLVILRKPFGRDAAPQLRFRVIEGSARLVWKDYFKIMHAAPRFSELPNEEQALANENTSDPNAYPSSGAIMLTGNAEQVDVPFTWSKSISGYLVIKTVRNDGLAHYLPLTDEKYRRVTLPTGYRYVWQVIDSTRAVVAGPYAFELRSGKGGIKDLINSIAKRPASSPPVDVRLQQ